VARAVPLWHPGGTLPHATTRNHDTRHLARPWKLLAVAVSVPARRHHPRDPQESVLVSVLEEHLDAFLQQVRDDTERSLPAFVERELRAIAACGDFTRGFLRLRCGDCRRDRILPFSCKSSVCPCCAGRTMAERAAWLTDRVLPNHHVGWRQVVVTFPRELAIGLCFDADLASRITRLCVRAIAQLQRSRALPDPGLGRARTAAVVWLQRFADGLGCWFHLHVLIPDGIFREQPGCLGVPFEPQPPPTPSELRALVGCIARRVTRLVSRRSPAPAAEDESLLLRCSQQPAHPGRGHATPPPTRPRRPTTLCAEHRGFTVHAATSIPPNRVDRLERLVRYMARPPVSDQRLRRRDDGRIELTLKRPRRGGVRTFVFEPLSFVARLAALIPRPGSHSVRYYGCLSSGSPLRPWVVPVPPDPTPDRPTAPQRPQTMPWADLMQRVFHEDVLACPCGGRLRIVAVLTQPDALQAVAAAIILSSQSSARAPPPRR